MSQKSEVLNHLLKNKYITSYQAFELFGATRLSAIIYDLRHDGYKIGGVWETCTNRYGDETRFLRYFLLKNKKGESV